MPAWPLLSFFGSDGVHFPVAPKGQKDWHLPGGLSKSAFIVGIGGLLWPVAKSADHPSMSKDCV